VLHVRELGAEIAISIMRRGMPRFSRVLHFLAAPKDGRHADCSDKKIPRDYRRRLRHFAQDDG
jgi:hypothetical protein